MPGSHQCCIRWCCSYLLPCDKQEIQAVNAAAARSDFNSAAVLLTQADAGLLLLVANLHHDV
jgi:hypothetical protein